MIEITNMKHYDVDQNSEEWFMLRLGKITSSNFDKICANMGKAFGEPAKKYGRKKALERMTGLLDDTDNLSNKYLERGHELEPLAIELYEMQTFNKVNHGGFFCNDIIGDSPDGLVGKNGCVEVKSVIPSTHWKTLERGDIDTAYKWQLQGHLINREWCDWISYCPEFKPYPIFIKRVYRDELKQNALIERLYDFNEYVTERIQFINELKNNDE